MRKGLLALSILILGANIVGTQDMQITVCNAGCDFPNSNLQGGINSATPGAEILLQEGYTYQGSFYLPRHGGTSYVTIRTGVSATGTVLATTPGNFPATSSTRVTPAIATTGNFAKLQSITSNVAAVRTLNTSTSPVAQYWRLKWVEGLWNASTSNFGSGPIFQFGDDSSTNQPNVNLIPNHFELDQVYIHGHPNKGQYRGIEQHANFVTLKNSEISDIKTISGNEGQAIWGSSFETTMVLQNNKIYGGAEVVMFGGSNGCCNPGATVLSSGRTTTQATFSTTVGLHVGQDMRVTVGGLEIQNIVASCGTSTAGASCTSDTVTFQIPLPSAPDSPGGADWGPVPTNIDILGNTIGRPASWYTTPIVGTPTGLSATPSASGGSLASGERCYTVVARIATYNSTARSAAPTQQCATVTGPTGSVLVSWTAVANAETYYIYEGVSGTLNARFSVTAPTVNFLDTGQSGTAENAPTSAGTKWYMKNTLELKNVDDVLVEGNIIENAWKDGQNGFCHVYTGANTGNGNDSTHVRNVITRYNIIRGCAGGVQITGRDVSTTAGGQLSGRAGNFQFLHNLWYDMGPQWGATVQAVLLTTTDPSTKVYYPGGEAVYPMGPYDLVFNHNTFIMESGSAFLWLDLYKGGNHPVDNFTWQNNLTFKTSSGLTGNNSCSQGDGCWTTYTRGTRVWQNNVVGNLASSGAGSCTTYPGGCTETMVQTSVANMRAQFNNYTAGDYTLAAGSPYNNAATDGTDIGADIPAVLTATGGGTAPPAADPPVITTVSLPNATVGVPYSEFVAVTGGTLPLTFSVFSGTLPTGITLNTATGELSGSASGSPATASFTIRASDATGTPRTDDQALTLTVVAAPSTMVITTATPLANGVQNSPYCLQFVNTGGTGPFTWSISAGTPPPVLAMSETGEYCGSATTVGSYSFTVRVADSLGSAVTKAFAHQIVAPSVGCDRQETRLGGIPIQAGTFVGSVAPSESVCVGDVWRNTGTTPPTSYIATSSSPSVIWERDLPPFSAHTLESHENVVATPAVGTILVGSGDDWIGLLPGAAGSYVCSNGVGISYCDDASGLQNLNASQLTTGTVPLARLPAGIGGSTPRTFLFVSSGSSFSWTMSNTAAQFSSNNDIFADLTGVTECRIFVKASVIADAVVWIRYNTTAAVTTTDLGSTSETIGVSLATITDGMALGSWTNVVAGAKTFVRLGFWGRSTSGATNGAVRNVGLVCR